MCNSVPFLLCCFELQRSESLSLTKVLREWVQNGVFISEQGVYHVNYILLSVLRDNPRGLSFGESQVQPWTLLIKNNALVSNLNVTVCGIYHCIEQLLEQLHWQICCRIFWGAKGGTGWTSLLYLIALVWTSQKTAVFLSSHNPTI